MHMHNRYRILLSAYCQFTSEYYRVTLVVKCLGWVDLDLGSSPGLWATAVATYCPTKVLGHQNHPVVIPSTGFIIARSKVSISNFCRFYPYTQYGLQETPFQGRTGIVLPMLLFKEQI